MKSVVIIPARYGSSRYKGKPLAKILGREMILRVADICSQAVGKKNTYVATDHIRIKNVVKNFGYNVIMTSKKCLTGTDRVAEAAKKISSDIYINVQGDEPTIEPKDIKKIIRAKIKNPKYVICGYDQVNRFENPENKNLPKLVVNEKNELIYISRSLIPGEKKKTNKKFFKQVCIYGFNKDQLNKFYERKKKSWLEKIEDIEILRYFELNIKIKMIKLDSNSVAVDEVKDIAKAEKLLIKKKIIFKDE